MKNSTVIKILLLLYIVIGTAGIAWYLTPESMDDSAFSETSPSARKEALKKKNPSAVETETQAESSYASEDIPSSTDDVFVPDEWTRQIDDFLSRLNRREENAGDTTSEPADDTAVFTKGSIPRVIIDTDFASDADDVVAVRLALCLQDSGLADIRGIPCRRHTPVRRLQSMRCAARTAMERYRLQWTPPAMAYRCTQTMWMQCMTWKKAGMRGMSFPSGSPCRT